MKPVALPLRGNTLVIVNGDLDTVKAQLADVANVASVSAPSGWRGIHIVIGADVVTTCQRIREATGTTLPKPQIRDLANAIKPVATTIAKPIVATHSEAISKPTPYLLRNLPPANRTLTAPTQPIALLPAPPVELTLADAGKQIRLAAEHISLVDVLDANYRYYSCFDQAAMLSRARTETNDTVTLSIVGKKTSVYLLGVRVGYSLEAVA